MASPRVVSGRLGGRVAVGVLAVVLFGSAAAWAVVAAVSRPEIPQIVLATIAVAWLVVVVVMAVESLTASVVTFSEEGYRRPLGGLRPWEHVVRVGSGIVEGQRTPTVAMLAPEGDFPIIQDEFASFNAPGDTEALVQAMLSWVPDAARGDFSGVELRTGFRASIEESADRVEGDIEALASRRPVSRQWIEFGYPGLESAILLDYGQNSQGEGVQVIVRHAPDLALVVEGQRWIRVNKKRTPPVAEGCAALFGTHTTTREDADGIGFDRLMVEADGQRQVQFNAEEPDRFH